MSGLRIRFLTRFLIGTAFLAVLLAPLPGASQGKKGKSPAKAPSVAAQVNEEYTVKIREYTTEKFFLTEFVDHLPASDKVPSPDKVLGYVIGTPDRLTYTKDINRYMRELEKASPRVKVFSIGLSDEGREVLAVVISDEANIARLERIKDINGRLADPRKVKDEAEAAALIAETKPIYWMSGSIHSPETGSPEMLMELAYRLAVEESPFIQNLRRNVIAMITPASEVDGHDREVDVYRYRKDNPKKQAPSLLYWGKYVAHDNNRDGMTLSLRLSQIMMKNFLDFHPIVLHDLHESVPFLYTSTGSGPYNSWLDPIVVNEWQELAFYEVGEFAKRGVPGVWTHGFYDGWAPNYMFYIANGHNSIGRFYETFGGNGADSGDRTVPASQTTRAWYRPNPPLPRVKWSIRNNINMQQSGVLMAMGYVAENRDRMLRNFYLKSRRSVEKATAEGPAAYVIPATEKRAYDAADLVNLLRRQACEVHVANETIKTKDGDFPAGSFIVRMDQPYSRMADMLLDSQFFNVNEPRPYDDTGWTLGALKNVKTVRVKDPAILKGSMSLLATDARPKGALQGTGRAAYVIPHNADNNLVLLRFRLPDVRMLAAEEPFEAEGQKFGRGSFVIPATGDLRDRLAGAAERLGVPAFALAEMPKVATHALAVPRMAILHTWTSTQNEGWYRLAFDTLGIPYSYISDHDIRDDAGLKSKYDVIIFPPVGGGSAQRLVNGSPMRGDPVPWKATEKYPNLTGPNGAQTDDMRGGMGLEGVLNLKKFVEQGGLFAVVQGNSSIPIDFGLVEGISIVEARQLQARGSVLSAEVVDKKSPITYGYDDKLPLYFSGAPVLNLVTGFGGRGGFGEFFGGAPAGGRETGRGSVNDPDVVQARALFVPPKREEGEDGIPPEYREMARNLLPPEELRPRVLLRWAPEKELLISGMLAGGSELAGKPAVLDAPLGKGHILFFATNPFWRMETTGSYMLLFNAALNFDNLTPRKAPEQPKDKPMPE
ncbi:MAG TPA: M14 family zinc carboxypeptidase [Acidobacteriota bacterium]|nr:M14 family zinc carboxypeptidase [Acidobacteriota bacterium]